MNYPENQDVNRKLTYLECKMKLLYEIGRKYRYGNQKKSFKLKSVKNNMIFHFECGHWCTDLVFQDMIISESGIKNIDNKQLKLFNLESF